MKTSTLITIANRIRKIRGTAPKMTVSELSLEVATASEGCNTKQEAAQAISQALWGDSLTEEQAQEAAR